MEARCNACGARIESAAESGLCGSCAFQLALEAAGDDEEVGGPPGRGEDPLPPEIPGYTVHELLGRGGMGAVWRAEQREPVRREVAVKVVAAGFDSGEVAARFRAERQALALMDHPHVARYFDSGTTGDGRPFFVMEYVPGLPITEYCNRERIPVEARVGLFADICETVHHAHQKGILHRDLKPSNILVLSRNGRPEPRIIDFGIAKATRPRVFDHSGMTRADQVLGTPEYMSPEQMARGERDVDVRSDVYSLGAVLYELLSGARPFDPGDLDGAGLEGMLRTVQRKDVPTPSQRVTSLGPAGRPAADARATGPAALASKLRGELDWITMKALAKEPERRYQTAAALAEDQRRFLRHEPVEAGPPGLAYRARKFVRRHPVAMAAAGIAALSLVVLAAVMTVQAGRLARERDRAAEQAAVSEEVTDFLVELFRVSDPNEAAGRDVTARELLDRGAARIREEVTDPAVRARLVGEMGVVYRNLGLREEAGPLLAESARLHEEAFGRDDPRTLVARDELAFHWSQVGRRAEAESVYVDVIEAWRRIAGDDAPQTLDALHNLAVVLRGQGRLAEAESLLVLVLGAHRRLGTMDDAGAMAALRNLAATYGRQRDFPRAQPVLEEALERRRRVLGPDHPLTLQTQSSLGENLAFLERFAEAESLLQVTAEAQAIVVGTEHPTYWATRERLAKAQWLRGDLDAAAEGLAAVVGYRREALGPESASTLTAQHNLAALLSTLGRWDAADSLAAATFHARLRTLGEEHDQTVSTVCLRAINAARRGDPAGAMEHLRQAVRFGLRRRDVMEHEAFDPVRGRAEFRALAEEVAERAGGR